MSRLDPVGSLSYKPTSCDNFTTDPAGAMDARAAGPTVLRYDVTADQYVYAWATPSTPGCATFFLTLASGQRFSAYVRLS